MLKNSWHRLRTASPRSATALAVDLGLAAVFLVLLLVERLVVAPVPAESIPVAVAAGIGIATSLALRRRAPLAAFVLSSVALVGGVLVVQPSWLSPYANQIGVYSVGLHATRQRALWGLGILFACIVGYFAIVETRPSSIAGVLFLWLLAWGLGYGGARRREEQQTARLLMRRQAIAEERTRIARELHDLIGHTVNLMLVQAGAGRRVLDRDPAKTRELLTSLEQTGRGALTELDRVLGILRHVTTPAVDGADMALSDSGSRPASGHQSTHFWGADRSDIAHTGAGYPSTGNPDIQSLDVHGLGVEGPGIEGLGIGGLERPPGLADLPDLARRMTQAGIRVELRSTIGIGTEVATGSDLQGEPGWSEIPRSLDLSAYRIVQESLTNALKHGEAVAARVTVRLDGGILDIEVCDDGYGPPPSYVPGRGLLGIGERAALFGGSVEHGPGEQGGFRIHALLPLPERDRANDRTRPAGR